jgi:hypothetical protein
MKKILFGDYYYDNFKNYNGNLLFSFAAFLSELFKSIIKLSI